SATAVPGSTALPFVISTGAQRSGEICVSAVSSWATAVEQLLFLEAPPFPLSSRPERSVVERSAFQRSPLGRLLLSNCCPWKHRPSLCHLDRSAPGFPTSRCYRRPRVRLSVERAACISSKPR